MDKPKLKVLLPCSGLGNVKRGYESFTRECFDALRMQRSLDMTLFKGAGPSDAHEQAIWNIPRESRLAKLLGKWTRRSPYRIEQLTFVACALPRLLLLNPDVILFSDDGIGNLLWHIRRAFRLRYLLVLSNGGPFEPPFPRWDHVQQVSSEHMASALVAGVPAEKLTLLPYGFKMPAEWTPMSASARNELRQQLGLPIARKIVIAIGAINGKVKRMDYVIREVASLTGPGSFGPPPFLLLLGHQDRHSKPILELAGSLLGPGNYLIKTVDLDLVPSYLRAADVFVHGALFEGFGRVYVEAMLNGLPCLAHDFATARFVLGPSGTFADFRQPGALAGLLREALRHEEPDHLKRHRHADAYARFSWQRLAHQYAEMLRHVASTGTRRLGKLVRGRLTADPSARS